MAKYRAGAVSTKMKSLISRENVMQEMHTDVVNQDRRLSGAGANQQHLKRFLPGSTLLLPEFRLSNGCLRSWPLSSGSSAPTLTLRSRPLHDCPLPPAQGALLRPSVNHVVIIIISQRPVLHTCLRALGKSLCW